MAKKRPLGVTLLAILAIIGAVLAIFHTLQMLHLFPIRGPFGLFAFFTFDLFGAILWGVLALIYIWVASKLWTLDPQGWLFLAVLASLNLILAVVSILGRSTWQAMLASILVNGLILLYLLLPGTKDAFGMKAAETETPVRAGTIEPELENSPVTPENPPATPESENVEPEIIKESTPEVAVTGGAALSHDLAYVEGIGEVYSGRLKAVGVDTPQALLEKGSTPKGRKELAEAADISEHLILKWVNHADLFRISGVGSEYADLLEASGVDTVVELAQRNPANLFAKLGEVNAQKSLVRRLPTQSQVEDWVNQAKNLPRAVHY